jgi:hypothetical protein
MSGMNRLVLAILLYPVALVAQTNFTINSPVDSSAVTVTSNQSLPVLMTIYNLNSVLIPEYYSTQITVSPTCPPAANPCANYVVPMGPVPSFALYGSHSFSGPIATINFQNAPPGFYTIKLAVNIQGCPNALTCQVPYDTFSGNIQFTAQVVSAIGAPSNVLPHFAVGGSFVTDFIIVNNSSQAAKFSINFYTDSGAPASLPFNGLGTLSTLADSLPGFGTAFYEAGGPQFPLQGDGA